MPIDAEARRGALRRLALQQAATRALAEADDLPAALCGILESVCLALEWRFGEAWMIDGAPEARLLAQWHPPGVDAAPFEEASQAAHFERGHGLPGRVWARGAPVFVPDVTVDTDFPRRGAAETAGIRSAIGVPISVDGRVIGVLDFFADRVLERDEELIRSIHGIGQQIGNVARRRQAEAEVRRSEARKRAVLDASLDAIVSIDTEGLILEWNRAAEAIFGYPEAEVVGRSMSTLIIPDHLRARHEEGFARHLATGDHTILGRRIELEGKRRDGDVFPVELTVMRLPGEPAAFTATLRDIGDRRRAEARLEEEIRLNETLQRLALAYGAERDRERLLQLITDTATMLVEAEYGAFFFNVPQADGGVYTLYALSGAARERFRSFPLPRKTPLFAPTFDGVGIVRLDDVRLDPRYGADGPQPPGHPTVVSYLAVPVETASGEVLGGLFFGHPEAGRFSAQHERIVAGIAAHAAVALENLRLYEELEEREEEARRAYRMAAEADHRKDSFIAMLSHELRNPLAPIMTAVELMSIDPEGDSLDSARTTIERQAKHLLRLVDDLLDVSRITRGKISLERRTSDLGPVILSAVEQASPLFEEKGHHLHVDLDNGLWMRADPGRVSQVVTNLLTNAARYTEPGGNVWLRAARVDGEIEIRVRDDGKGIAPALLERVFEPFSQGEQGIDRAAGGLGLGLALVRLLTEAHDGTVEGSSDGDGEGAEFVVRLPALDLAPGEEPVLTPAHGLMLPDLPERRRVLVVDDNPDAAELLARGLTRVGYEVKVAHDGPEALSTASSHPIEVAVLDIGLPVMSGYELASRLRAMPGGEALRLVAVTGYGQRSDRERAAAAGFDAHLVKPVTIDQLDETIRGGG